jgi:HlyD family secretion protein
MSNASPHLNRLPGLLLRLTLVAVALYGGWRGWHYWQKQHKKAPEYVTEAAVLLPTLAERTTATGTLQALVTVQIGSQISGRITTLHADFNTRVQAGDLLAELDPTLLRSAQDQARANLHNQQAGVAKAMANWHAAQRTRARVQHLFDQHLATAADLDAAVVAEETTAADVKATQAQVTQARANLELTQTNLNYARIFSPIDGVVLSRNVDIGQTVAASLQAPVLFTIARDLREMQVHASVDEADIGKLREGMPATFSVDAFHGDAFRGRVSQLRLSPQVLQNVVTYDAVIDVRNVDERLRPGMTATVTFETARRTRVLAVPNAALRWRPGPEDRAITTKPAKGGQRAVAGLTPPLDAAAGGPESVAMAAAASETGEGDGKKHKKKHKHDDEQRALELAGEATDTEGVPQSRVYVLRAGELVAIDVTTGISDGRFTEIVAGKLQPGDQVIVRREGGQGGSASSGGSGKSSGKLPKKLF